MPGRCLVRWVSCGVGHNRLVRVLVVEDQVDLADDIAEGLRDQGMAADVAYDTTWWCWIGTCPGCTGMPCVRHWWVVALRLAS